MRNKLSKLRISIFVFVIVLTNISGYTQEQYFENPMIYPPTPNVAALIGYSETQVELSAGLPSIRIPLYNIKQGNLQVPISLNYSTGGIRVEEVASWVGLGWSLSCGGVISRTVQGLPDDTYNDGYMNTTNTVQNLVDNGYNTVENYSAIALAIDGYRDFEPDIFHISCPGFSGKFFWDQRNNEFIQMPKSNVRIETEKSGGEIVGWIVTTDDGTKYYFGMDKSESYITGQEYITDTYDFYWADGYAEAENDGREIGDYIGAWHLMEIVGVDNKNIKFSYAENVRVEQVLLTSESSLSPSCEASGRTVSFVERNFNEKIPSEIIFDKGKVVFYPSETTRLDLENSRTLNRVEIQYTDGSLFKSYNFDYDYFTSDDEGVWSGLGDNRDVRLKRLYLKELYEADKNGFRQNPYKFKYNDEILPDRFSADQDFWGFFNDKGNTSLIPEVTIFTQGFIGGDRSVNSAVSQACNLEKITYPTGGSEEFIYEQNRYSYIRTYWSSAQIPLFPEFSTLYTKTIYFEKDISIQTDIGTYEKEFSIPNGIASDVEFNITVNTGCDVNEPISGDCDYLIYIKGVSNDFSKLIHGTGSYYLEPGDYKLLAILENDQSIDNNFSSTINYKYNVSTNGYETAGLRIKEIITKDNNGNEYIKQYEYGSGGLMNIPIKVYTNFLNGLCETSQHGIKIVSCGIDLASSYKGSNVGYRKVTTYFVDPESSGKTEYDFDVPSKERISLSGYEDLIPFSFDYWRQGALEELRKYSFKDGVYELVSKEINDWEVFERDKFFDVGIKIVPTISDSYVRTCLVGYYGYQTEWYRLNEKITELYYPNNTIINTVNYNYDHNPIIASSQETKNSSGEVLTTKYYYPPDVDLLADITGTDYTVIEEMEDLNMIQVPIQIEKYRDDGTSVKLLEKKRILYKDFEDNDIIMPYKIMTSYDSADDFVNEIDLIEYDEKGNLLYSIKRNGEKNCYLWSYNYEYPVAIINGISYSEIVDLLGDQSDITSLSESTNTQVIESTLEDLRTNLSFYENVQLTTMLYDMLKGAVSVTDPNELTTAYDYDNFGRLSLVKDNEGNILNRYSYHLESQPIAGFEIVNSDINIEVLPSSGIRKISLGLIIENTDPFDQTCHLECVFEGEPQENWEQEIVANETATFNTSWTLDPGNVSSKQITISRDVYQNSSIVIPYSAPSEMNFLSYEINENVETGEVVANVSYNNTGGAPDLVQVVNYIYENDIDEEIEDFENLSSDWILLETNQPIINVELEAGQTDSYAQEFILPHSNYAFILKDENGLFVAGEQFIHKGTPVFEISSAGIITNTNVNSDGTRTIEASVVVNNIGTGIGKCELDFNLEGVGSKNPNEQYIQSGSSSDPFTVSWTIAEGFDLSKNISITGGITAETTVNIPASPAKLVWNSLTAVSVEADNYNITVDVSNIGYENVPPDYYIMLWRFNNSNEEEYESSIIDYSLFSKVGEQLITEYISAQTSNNIYTKLFTGLEGGFYWVEVKTLNSDPVISTNFDHVGTPVFVQSGSMSASSSVISTGRSITASATVNNTGSGNGDCTLHFNLEGIGIQTVPKYIAHGSSESFSVNWNIGKGIATSKTITITGDINDSGIVSIPASPAEIKLQSYVLSGDINNGDVRAIASYTNIGGLSGTVQVVCDVYKCKTADHEIEDITNISSSDWELVDGETNVLSIAPGATKAFDEIFTLYNGFYVFVLVQDGEPIDAEYADISSSPPPPPPVTETFEIEIRNEDNESFILDCILTTSNNYSTPTVKLKAIDSSGDQVDDDSEIVSSNPRELEQEEDNLYERDFTVNKPEDSGTYYLRALLYDGSTYLGIYEDISYVVN